MYMYMNHLNGHNGEKWIYLQQKKLSALLEEQLLNITVTFII